MTEAEWLACAVPRRMVTSLNTLMDKVFKDTLCERKLRLFAAACCRSALELVNPPASGTPAGDLSEHVRFVERIADGLVPAPTNDLDHHYGFYTLAHRGASPTEWACHAALSPSAWGAATGVIDALDDTMWDDGATNCGTVYLRDIFGNPFRRIAFPPEWCTDTAVSLAKGMYASRDFSAMPILADALQDAGCDNADVLNHCRGDGPHVRGCWVVDLILGKS